jgi:hypothetical protein
MVVNRRRRLLSVIPEAWSAARPIDYARRRWVFRDLDIATPARLRKVGQFLDECVDARE